MSEKITTEVKYQRALGYIASLDGSAESLEANMAYWDNVFSEPDEDHEGIWEEEEE